MDPLQIPLHFWFGNSSGLALPFIALPLYNANQNHNLYVDTPRVTAEPNRDE